MKSFCDAAWGPHPLPTDKQRWNFLEKIYADYNEVNQQQEEIAARKRGMMAELPEGNKDEIHQILFSDDPSSFAAVGNLETYEKVEQILKKFVYCRGPNVFEPVKPDAVFSERIDILKGTCAEQSERIASLERSLAAAQDELAGLMNILQLKDKEIKNIKMSTRVELLKATHKQRVLEASETSAKTNQTNIFKDMNILIEINKAMERENARLRATLNAKSQPVRGEVKHRVPLKRKSKEETVVLRKDSETGIGRARLSTSRTSDAAQKRKDESRHSANVSRRATPSPLNRSGTARGAKKTSLGGDDLVSVDQLWEDEDRDAKTSTVVKPETSKEEDSRAVRRTIMSPRGSIAFNASLTSAGASLACLNDSEELEKLAGSSSRLRYIREKAPVTAVMVRLHEEREMWERQLEAEIAHNMSCRDYDAYKENITKRDAECGTSVIELHEFLGARGDAAKRDSTSVNVSWLDAEAESRRDDSVVDVAHTVPVGSSPEPLQGDGREENKVRLDDDKGPLESGSVGSAASLDGEDLPGDGKQENQLCVDDKGPLNSESVGDATNSPAAVSPRYKKDGNKICLDDTGLLGFESVKSPAKLVGEGLPHASEETRRESRPTDLSRLSASASKSTSRIFARPSGGDEHHTPSAGTTSITPDRDETLATLRTQSIAESSPQKTGKRLSGHPAPHIATSEVVAGDKRQAAKKKSDAGRQTKNKDVRLCGAVYGLRNEMAIVRDDHHAMRREMNEFFSRLGQFVAALRAHNEELEHSIQTASEAFAAEMAEDMVKDMVERRVLERLEKLGIVLQRYPGPSSGLTDEEWVQNQLYDFIFRTSRDNITSEILNANEKQDEGREAGADTDNPLLQGKTTHAPKTSFSKTPDEAKKGGSLKEGICGEETCKSGHARRSPVPESTSVVTDSKKWSFLAPVTPRGKKSLENANANSEQRDVISASGHVSPTPWEGAGTKTPPWGCWSDGGGEGGEEARPTVDVVSSSRGRERKEWPYTSNCIRVSSLSRNSLAAPLGHEGLQGRSQWGVGAAVPSRRFKGDILEYLRALQPNASPGSIEGIAPAVQQYDFRNALARARSNVQQTLRSAADRLRGPYFEEFFRRNILPYASAARSLQKGRRMAPWFLAAIRQLRIEEIKRNKKIRRVIFQRVVTNVRARRLLKSSVCKGSALASFVIILWKRWLENMQEEHTTLRLERGADLNRMLDLMTANLRGRSQQQQQQQQRQPTETREPKNMRNPLSDPSSSHFSEVRFSLGRR